MNDCEKISITYLRVVATMLILLCHLVQMSSNPIIALSSQVFNIGVYLFIMMSAFLYGKRVIKEKTSYLKWLFTRATKILIPMYILLIFIIAKHHLDSTHIDTVNYFVYVFNLQGIQKYIPGAEHLWYLTVAMFCYLITPLLEIYRKKIKNKKYLLLIFIFLITLQILFTIFIKQIAIYFNLLMVYLITYFMASFFKINFKNKKLFISSIIFAIIALVIRVVCQKLFDNTVFYEVFAVGYTSIVLSLCLFFGLFYIIHLLGNTKCPEIIKFFESISYEIYLVHYMFINSPFSLRITNSVLINAVLISVVSFVAAFILNKISKIVEKKILSIIK